MSTHSSAPAEASSAAQPSSADSPEVSSSQPKSSQNLSFRAEYTRQTVSQYGYIDSQGKLHWNPDFLDAVSSKNLPELLTELKKIEEKNSAQSFVVTNPQWKICVLWKDGSATELQTDFDPFSEKSTAENRGKVTKTEHCAVAAIAAGGSVDVNAVVIMEQSGKLTWAEGQTFSDCKQGSIDPVSGYLAMLTSSGKIAEYNCADLKADGSLSVNEWNRLVQISYYGGRLLGLQADGTLLCANSGAYQNNYGGSDGATLPTQTDILRLFPGTPWFLAADGTLYNVSPQQGKPKKLANQTGIDQIFSAGDGWCALKTDGTIVGLAGTEPDEWLAGLKNVMVVTK